MKLNVNIFLTKTNFIFVFHSEGKKTISTKFHMEFDLYLNVDKFLPESKIFSLEKGGHNLHQVFEISKTNNFFPRQKSIHLGRVVELYAVTKPCYAAVDRFREF